MYSDFIHFPSEVPCASASPSSPPSLRAVTHALLQACQHLCTSMFANRPDRTTAVRQTQNTNINKQTNPFTHPNHCEHFVHMQPNFKALTQPAVTRRCLPAAALFGSYSVHFCDHVSLLIDGVRESPASLSDKALA